jgi:hypothetical protein
MSLLFAALEKGYLLAEAMVSPTNNKQLTFLKLFIQFFLKKRKIKRKGNHLQERIKRVYICQ